MAMPSLRRIAIALILAGVVFYASSTYWLTTRKLIPLDVPISLSRGHIRTAEFSINLDSGYYIEIEVEGPSRVNLDCLMWGCPETPALLRVQWALSSAGHVELSGSSDGINGGSGNWGVVGRKVGYFRSSGGRYRLDVDVLSDTNVLNAGHPRLKVEADGEGYNRLSRLYEGLPIVSAMLVVMGGTWLLMSGAIGGVMLLLSRTKQKTEQSTSLGMSAAPHLGPQSAGSRRGLPLRALFSGLPSYGLCAGLVLSLLAISMYVVAYTPPPVGIWVLTSDRSLKTPRYGQSDKPLVLRIDRENRWFLNGTPVSPEEFPGALKKALDRRLDWVVYLNASPELELGAPARAMDMIQGLHAKIVLVTPSTEKDCCAGTGNR